MTKPEITILRLGHRPSRDKRVTTHCALAARAFGASKIIISGEEDAGLVLRLNALAKKWGGKFKAEYEKDWKRTIRGFGGTKIHLTMYGEGFRKVISMLRRKKCSRLLLVVGAGKVPRELYGLCDYNAAVGSQPHSEVAAIALFLYELCNRELAIFHGGKIGIIPSARGKNVKSAESGGFL